jgi:hypothetical protein
MLFAPLLVTSAAIIREHKISRTFAGFLESHVTDHPEA